VLVLIVVWVILTLLGGIGGIHIPMWR
jgi:hypothetical protein